MRECSIFYNIPLFEERGTILFIKLLILSDFQAIDMFIFPNKFNRNGGEFFASRSTLLLKLVGLLISCIFKFISQPTNCISKNNLVSKNSPPPKKHYKLYKIFTRLKVHKYKQNNDKAVPLSSKRGTP